MKIVDVPFGIAHRDDVPGATLFIVDGRYFLGTSAMLHFGQAPAVLDVTSGCIGHA